MHTCTLRHTYMRKGQRAEARRAMLDTLGRCNSNKRGRKSINEQELHDNKQQHTSRFKRGVTCKYSRNVITLPDGRQVLEGSLSHLQSR